MTDRVAPRAKAPSDVQMLAQVEQWMAMIRELVRQERPAVHAASERLDHLLATVTE